MHLLIFHNNVHEINGTKDSMVIIKYFNETSEYEIETKESINKAQSFFPTFMGKTSNFVCHVQSHEYSSLGFRLCTKASGCKMEVSAYP